MLKKCEKNEKIDKDLENFTREFKSIKKLNKNSVTANV